MQISALDTNTNVYTVSQLNHAVKGLLEDVYPYVWVEGEISNLAIPSSGHCYFSLKDNAAQVRCAMFKMQMRKLIFKPKDGMHILIRARVSLYENRGEYQLIADFMEERGEGKLRRAYEVLKQKLEAAGLFNPDYKKPLPSFPQQIGVITSPTGAAIRDILTVLQRRYPHAPVIIYPTLVQGTTAAPLIVKAIQRANERNECDVLVLARGGGSLEDLWPFNEEVVAHAIFSSKLPIISGVGHEVDFTIADFVADHRAATPTAAAELITPVRQELLQTLNQAFKRLGLLIKQQFNHQQQRLDWATKHLANQHPKRRLIEKMQRLDLLELSLLQQQKNVISLRQQQLKVLDVTLHKNEPTAQIRKLQNQLEQFTHQLKRLLTLHLHHYQQKLGNAAATLDAISPLATLQRGYAIATNVNNKVLRKGADIKVGEMIKIKLAHDQIDCEVKQIHETQ